MRGQCSTTDRPRQRRMNDSVTAGRRPSVPVNDLRGHFFPLKTTRGRSAPAAAARPGRARSRTPERAQALRIDRITITTMSTSTASPPSQTIHDPDSSGPPGAAAGAAGEAGGAAAGAGGAAAGAGGAAAAGGAPGLEALAGGAAPAAEPAPGLVAGGGAFANVACTCCSVITCGGPSVTMVALSRSPLRNSERSTRLPSR